MDVFLRLSSSSPSSSFLSAFLLFFLQGIELFEALGDTKAASDLHLALSCFLLQPLISPLSSSSANFSQISLVKGAGASSGCSSSFSPSSLTQKDKGYLPCSTSHPFSSSSSHPYFSSSSRDLFPERYCTCISISSSSSSSFFLPSSLDSFSSLTSGGPHDSVVSISLSLLRAAENGYFSSGSDILHSSVISSGMMIREDRPTSGQNRERKEKEKEEQQRSSSLFLSSSSFSSFSGEENRHVSILLQCISRLEEQERRLHCAVQEKLSKPIPQQPPISSSSSSFSSSSLLSPSEGKETPHAYHRRQQPSTSSNALSSACSSSSTAMERTGMGSCPSSRGDVSSEEEEILDQGEEDGERGAEKVKKKKNAKAVAGHLGEEDTACERDKRKKIQGGVENDEREEYLEVENGSIKLSSDSCLFCSLQHHKNDKDGADLVGLKRLHGGVCTLLACLYLYLVRWQLKAIPFLVRPPSSRENEKLSSLSKTTKQDKKKKIDRTKDSSDGNPLGVTNMEEISPVKRGRHVVKDIPPREKGEEIREEAGPAKEQGRQEEEKKKETEDTPVSACETERTRENDKKKKTNMNGHLKKATPLISSSSSSSSPPSCSSSSSSLSRSRLEECWYASEVVTSLPFGLLPFLHLKTSAVRDTNFSASTDAPQSREERRDRRRKTAKEAERTLGNSPQRGEGVPSGEPCMDKEKEGETIEGERDEADEEKEEKSFIKVLYAPFGDKQDIDEQEEDTAVSILLEKIEKSLKRVLEVYEIQESLLVSLYHRLSLSPYGCRDVVSRSEEHDVTLEDWRPKLRGRREAICGDHIEFSCQRLLIHNAAGLAHLFLSCIALREVYVHPKKHHQRTGKEGSRENRSFMPSRRKRNGISRDIVELGGEASLCKNLSLSLRMKIRGKLRSALYHAEKATEALQSCCSVEGYQKKKQDEKKNEDESMSERRTLRVSAEEGRRKERKKATKKRKEEKREEKGEERQKMKEEKEEKEERKTEERRTRVGLERETTSVPLARRLCERCHLEIIDTHTRVYVHHPNPPYTAFVSSCLLLSFTHELVSKNSSGIPLASSPATSSHSLQTFSSSPSSFLTSSTVSSSRRFIELAKFLSSPRMAAPKNEERRPLQSEERCSSSLATSRGRRRERRRSSQGEEVKKVDRRDERTSERERSATSIGLALQAVRRIACICPRFDNVRSTASREDRLSSYPKNEEEKQMGEEQMKNICRDVVADREEERERQVSPLCGDSSVGLLFFLRNEREKSRSLTPSRARYRESNLASPRVSLFSPENTELFRKLMKDTNGIDRGQDEEQETKKKDILHQEHERKREEKEEGSIMVERTRGRSEEKELGDEDHDEEGEDPPKRTENEREIKWGVSQSHKRSVMVDVIEESRLPLALQECTLQRLVSLLLLQDEENE